MNSRGLNLFRIYLKNKVEVTTSVDSMDSDLRTEINEQKQASRFRRNRRLAERYSPNHHQLSLMNGQDILHVSDLSETGFHTTMAEEALERFADGNLYEVKLKARKRSVGLLVRVMWQDGCDLGFKVEKQLSESPEHFRELILIFEIANSLREMTDSQTKANTRIFYGLGDVSLQVWLDSDGQLEGWRLSVQKKFLRWGRLLGVETGVLVNPHADALLLSMDQEVIWDFVRHDEVDRDFLEFGFDVIYAWQDPLSREILLCGQTG